MSTMRGVEMTIHEIQNRLFEMQDLKYKEFHSKLIPTINPDAIIGVRTPELRKFAKELGNEQNVKEFLDDLPHQYYEENNLHAFLIEMINDYEECIKALNVFLPYVDNWATCDMMAPKVFKKHLSELRKQIKKWLDSEHIYEVRFAVDMLMKYYLDEKFETEYLDWVADIDSEEYYLKMVKAWFFATALAKQYEVTVPYIENQYMDKWTHNKTIQKAVESYRIDKERKQYLKSWKRR